MEERFNGKLDKVNDRIDIVLQNQANARLESRLLLDARRQ